MLGARIGAETERVYRGEDGNRRHGRQRANMVSIEPGRSGARRGPGVERSRSIL